MGIFVFCVDPDQFSDNYQRFFYRRQRNNERLIALHLKFKNSTLLHLRKETCPEDLLIEFFSVDFATNSCF